MTTEVSIELTILNQILVHVKAATHPLIHSQLKSVLVDQKSREIYQLSDGSRSQKEIRKLCKTSPNSVSDLCKSCVSAGLMQKTEDGKSIRLFNLEDFGMI